MVQIYQPLSNPHHKGVGAGTAANDVPTMVPAHRPHTEPIELQNADRAPPPGHYAPLHTSTVVTNNAQYVQRGLQERNSTDSTTSEDMLGWKKPRDVVAIYEAVGRPNLIRSEGSDSSLRVSSHHLPYAMDEPVAKVVKRLSTRGDPATTQPEERSSTDSTTSEDMLGWKKPRDVVTIYEAVGQPNIISSEGSDSSLRVSSHHLPYAMDEPVVKVVKRLSTRGDPTTVITAATPPYHTTPTTAVGNATRSSVDSSQAAYGAVGEPVVKVAKSQAQAQARPESLIYHNTWNNAEALEYTEMDDSVTVDADAMNAARARVALAKTERVVRLSAMCQVDKRHASAPNMAIKDAAASASSDADRKRSTPANPASGVAIAAGLTVNLSVLEAELVARKTEIMGKNSRIRELEEQLEQSKRQAESSAESFAITEGSQADRIDESRPVIRGTLHVPRPAIRGTLHVLTRPRTKMHESVTAV